jgi:hypothetical protein
VDVGEPTEEFDCVVRDIAGRTAALVVAKRQVGKVIKKEVKEMVLKKETTKLVFAVNQTTISLSNSLSRPRPGCDGRT